MLDEGQWVVRGNRIGTPDVAFSWYHSRFTWGDVIYVIKSPWLSVGRWWLWSVKLILPVDCCGACSLDCEDYTMCICPCCLHTHPVILAVVSFTGTHIIIQGRRYSVPKMNWIIDRKTTYPLYQHVCFLQGTRVGWEFLWKLHSIVMETGKPKTSHCHWGKLLFHSYCYAKADTYVTYMFSSASRRKCNISVYVTCYTKLLMFSECGRHISIAWVSACTLLLCICSLCNSACIGTFDIVILSLLILTASVCWWFEHLSQGRVTWEF